MLTLAFDLRAAILEELLHPPEAITRSVELIEQNASSSPLLRLPAELRDRIWTEVLGDRLVHLDYKYFDDELTFDDFDYMYQSHFDRSPWRHIVCEDDGPEDRPKQKAVPNPKYFYAVPGAKERWVDPHAACDLDYEDPGSGRPIEYHDHEGMRLTVLRASHQIYAEANRILWTTNTFSFTDGIALQRFMMTRTIKQKRLIHNLRFDMEWGMGEDRYWNRALSLVLVNSLIGQRTLRLNILYDREAGSQHWWGAQARFLKSTSFTDGLRKLSILPLASAEISFRVREYRSNDPELWQKADRDECAKELQKILLNPNGAEIYEEYRRMLKENAAKNKELEEACARERRPFQTQQ
ncbi:MAG: hypothetical protein L6R36_001944 [Xanthoria steineri]|nr:MAG: hypothetical protein L6R36_001944 [Xanthoria steineri]